jgi:hypothetical protein
MHAAAYGVPYYGVSLLGKYWFWPPSQHKDPYWTEAADLGIQMQLTRNNVGVRQARIHDSFLQCCSPPPRIPGSRGWDVK